MGKSTYEDWVPAVDRHRFPDIERSIGELETNPLCREASSTLFWQVSFGLQQLSDVLEVERKVQATRIPGYSFDEALSALVSAGEVSQDLALQAQIRANPAMRKALQEELKLNLPPWIGFDTSTLDRILDVSTRLKPGSVMDMEESGEDTLLCAAFTQLHMLTALLIGISEGSWSSWEFAEDLLSWGQLAYGYVLNHTELYGGIVLSERRAVQLLQEAGYTVRQIQDDQSSVVDLTSPPASTLQEQREQSLCAVMSLFLNEQFKEHRRHNRNEEALLCFGTAVRLWGRSTSALEGKLCLQLAVDCCEDVYLGRSSVRDWQQVAEACWLISASLSDFPESDDLNAMDYVSDKQGWQWPAVSYWERAGTRAENEMSPAEFKRFQDLERESAHLVRLRSDFLGDLITVLEPESLRALVQAEVAWHESQPVGGRMEAMPNELRHVFETELRALVFNQAGGILSQILCNQALRDRLNVKSKHPERLSLREMAILLTEAGKTDSLAGPGMRRFIANLSISAADKGFLCADLPRYLHDLSDVRAKWEHPRNTDVRRLRDKTRDVRRRALGIGGKSYLERLLAIKNAARRS